MKINNFEIKTGLMLFFLLPALMWANFGRVWVQETVYESVSETFLPPTPSVISANGPLTFCIGDSVMLSGNTRGTWNTGDTTSSIIIKSSGDYFVTNTDSTGSISSNHLIVKVDSIPIASIITANDTIVFCNGDSVRLSGNAGGIWNTGDTSGSIVVRTSGDYFVTNSNTCDTVVSNHILITVKGADTSVISANKSTTLCMGDSIILSGNVNGTWSTGDTAFSINVKTSGNYFVIVTGACGSDTTNHIMVRFDTIPVVSVVAASDTTVFCSGDSVVLSGNIRGRWSNGDTAASITVKSSGDYFVINSNSCDTLTSNHIVVMVNPSPTASTIISSKSTTLCFGDSLILSGNTGGRWSTGDSTSTIVVKTAGDYFVTNGNACDTVISNHIVVIQDTIITTPVIVADGRTAFCTGDSVILSGNISGVWSTGDTTNTIVVKTSGDYFVTAVNECDSLISNHIVVQVNTPADDTVLQISASRNTALCEGDSVRLSGNHGFVWSNGDTSASIVVKTPGVYFLVNPAGCDTLASNKITITVSPRPLATLIPNDTLCQGQGIVLGTPAIAGHTYIWKTNSGLNVPTTPNPQVYPLLTTTYTLTEVITATGCSATNKVTITVGTLPSCVIKGKNIICDGETTQLCAPAGQYRYKWSTGDTTSCITVDSIGNYLVVVTNSLGCSSACSRNVVSGQTSGPITGKGFIYQGQSTEFCAPPGYTTYTWNTGATTRCIAADSAGTYSVTMSNSNGCISTSSTTLTVAPEVDCTIIGDSLLCRGGVSILCAVDVPGNTYYWNNGQTSRCITIDCEGLYAVTVTNNGLSNSCTLVVHNAPDTIAKPDSCLISGNLEPIQGDSSVLCATAGYMSYLWSTGLTTRCITIGRSGTYSVKMVSSGGCEDSCSAIVKYIASVRSNPVIALTNPTRTQIKKLPILINAYPNPFSQSALIEFRAPLNQPRAVIDIINVAGRKIATIFDQQITEGTWYQARLDGHNLAEGVYFYKITMGNQIINNRLVLIR